MEKAGEIANWLLDQSSFLLVNLPSAI
jgi:hypothetical protein